MQIFFDTTYVSGTRPKHDLWSFSRLALPDQGVFGVICCLPARILLRTGPTAAAWPISGTHTFLPLWTGHLVSPQYCLTTAILVSTCRSIGPTRTKATCLQKQTICPRKQTRSAAHQRQIRPANHSTWPGPFLGIKRAKTITERF